MKKIKQTASIIIMLVLLFISVSNHRNITTDSQLCLSDLSKINYSQAEEENGEDDENNIYSQSIIDIIIEKVTDYLK